MTIGLIRKSILLCFSFFLQVEVSETSYSKPPFIYKKTQGPYTFSFDYIICFHTIEDRPKKSYDKLSKKATQTQNIYHFSSNIYSRRQHFVNRHNHNNVPYPPVLSFCEEKRKNSWFELNWIEINTESQKWFLYFREGAFWGLNKVTRLSLYDNKIGNIEVGAFDGLTKWVDTPVVHSTEHARARALWFLGIMIKTFMGGFFF